jgi:GT2 family glycosyltransferase
MTNEVELNDINASSISVIMVSYMTGAALFKAINHVLLDTQISELIIIDNGNPEQVRRKAFFISEVLRSYKDKNGSWKYWVF